MLPALVQAPSATLQLALLALGVLSGLFLGGLAAAGRRVPLAAWLLPVVPLVAVGAVPAFQGLARTGAAAGGVGAPSGFVLTMGGAVGSISLYLMGLLGSALTLGVSIAAAGIGGLVGARRAPARDRSGAGRVLGVGLLGGVAVLGGAVAAGFAWSGLVSGLALLVGTVFVALGAARPPAADPGRAAEGRLGAPVSLALQLLCILLAGHGWATAWGASAHAAGGERAGAAAPSLLGDLGPLLPSLGAFALGLALIAVSVPDPRAALQDPRVRSGLAAALALVLILVAVHTGLCLQLAAAFEAVAPG